MITEPKASVVRRNSHFHKILIFKSCISANNSPINIVEKKSDRKFSMSFDIETQHFSKISP